MTISLVENPPSLFPADILTFPIGHALWRVAHVKSRREKALAHYLKEAGIGYFLPMHLRPQASRKRARFSLMPLFSGYLFFRADDRERHAALRSNHVARVIDVHDEARLLDELVQIQRALAANPEDGLQVHPYDMVAEGQYVQVVCGPFAGVKGRVVRKDNRFRLALSVQAIGQAILVSIDADHVLPLPDST